jgi:hypothetical protein
MARVNCTESDWIPCGTPPTTPGVYLRRLTSGELVWQRWLGTYWGYSAWYCLGKGVPALNDIAGFCKSDNQVGHWKGLVDD